MRHPLLLALLLAGIGSAAAQTGTDSQRQPETCARLDGGQRQECSDRLSRLGSQLRALQAVGGDRWVISETTSPIDYSPMIAASILSQAASGAVQLKLSIYCRRGRTDLEVTSNGPNVATAAGDNLIVTHSINRDSPVGQRWDVRGPVAAFKGDVVRFLRSLPEDGELGVRVSDGKSVVHEGRFALGGLNHVRDKFASACKWPADGAAPPDLAARKGKAP
jgi:hypothetical protein